MDYRKISGLTKFILLQKQIESNIFNLLLFSVQNEKGILIKQTTK